MLLPIHPDNPQDRLIQKVVSCLQNGGVIIYPTDTLYAFGCDITQKKAVERIARIKGIAPEKAQFSCICSDFKTVGSYTVQLSNPVFKLMRTVLPGPYTFILKASNNIPRHFQSKKKTVGIRVSSHPIPLAIVEALGNPILTSSIFIDENDLEAATDPNEIFDRYGKLVDMVIDGGIGGTEGSTVLDCSEGDIVVLREGLGFEELGLM